MLLVNEAVNSRKIIFDFQSFFRRRTQDPLQPLISLQLQLERLFIVKIAKLNLGKVIQSSPRILVFRPKPSEFDDFAITCSCDGLASANRLHIRQGAPRTSMTCKVEG